MARSGGNSNLFCVVPVHGFSEPGGIGVNFDYHILLWEKINDLCPVKSGKILSVHILLWEKMNYN